jgi:indolepyruvate ferredoxin oxidoreductase beta subunit
MKQQIIVSGTGGQGILFLTRFFAEAAMMMRLEVITSEIHGMAMRGGTVVSHVKVGPFKSPLVREGQADAGLILDKQNLELHCGLMKPGGSLFVNTDIPGDYASIDASALTLGAGAPALTNLVLLGFAIQRGGFFCDVEVARKLLHKLSPPAQLDPNLTSFDLGLTNA